MARNLGERERGNAVRGRGVLAYIPTCSTKEESTTIQKKCNAAAAEPRRFITRPGTKTTLLGFALLHSGRSHQGAFKEEAVPAVSSIAPCLITTLSPIIAGAMALVESQPGAGLCSRSVSG